MAPGSTSAVKPRSLHPTDWHALGSEVCDRSCRMPCSYHKMVSSSFFVGLPKGTPDKIRCPWLVAYAKTRIKDKSDV